MIRGPASTANRDQRRHDQQADDEALVADRGQEFALGDEPDLLHTALLPSRGPAGWRAAPARLSAPASLRDQPDEHVLEPDARQLDARAGATVAAIWRITTAGSVPATSRSSQPSSIGRISRDAGQLAQRREVGRGVERLEPDDARVVLTPQAGHRLVEHLAPLVDHHDVLAELLGVRHDVRREQDRRAAALLRRRSAP